MKERGGGSIPEEAHTSSSDRIAGLEVHKLNEVGPTTYLAGKKGVFWRNPQGEEGYGFGNCKVRTLTTERGQELVLIEFIEGYYLPREGYGVVTIGVGGYPPLTYDVSSRRLFSPYESPCEIRIGSTPISQPVVIEGLTIKETETGELPSVSVVLKPRKKELEVRDPESLASLIEEEGFETLALKFRIPKELLRYAYFRREVDPTWLNRICQATLLPTSWGPHMLEVITRLPLPSEVDTFACPSRNPFEALRKIQEYTPTVRWTIPEGI